jgi:hypothetical protein
VLASIDRTAYPRFRGTVTARELVESFTPTVDEVGWARGKTTADQTFLVLVIWLKCYQRMRYSPGLDEVSDAVAGHIRTALGLPDSVAVGVEAVRSAARYRDYVRERLGVKYDAADVRGIADTAIRAAAVTKDNPADLINVALEELLESGRELPGYTTLDRMAPGSAASMWVWEMPEDPVGWLDGLGWEAETFTLRERADAYGRPVLTPSQQDEGAGGLISAVRAAL